MGEIAARFSCGHFRFVTEWHHSHVCVCPKHGYVVILVRM